MDRSDRSIAGDAEVKWRTLFAECARHEVATRVRFPLAGRQPQNGPLRVLGEDGAIYWIKGASRGRSTFTDQVVGRIGEVLGAPVGKVVLIEVSEELAESRQLAVLHVDGSLCTVAHGSLHIPACYESMSIRTPPGAGPSPRLLNRYALLSILYGLAKANDRQYLYSDTDPDAVHSIDHGKFFPGGSNWSPRTLAAELAAHGCVPDPFITERIMLSRLDLLSALQSLKHLTDQVIARVVHGPPEQWDSSDEDRIALAEYLQIRRDQLGLYRSGGLTC